MMPFKLIYCILNGGKDATLAPSTGVYFLCPQMTLKEPLSSLRSAQALQLSYWKRVFCVHLNKNDTWQQAFGSIL